MRKETNRKNHMSLVLRWAAETGSAGEQIVGTTLANGDDWTGAPYSPQPITYLLCRKKKYNNSTPR